MAREFPIANGKLVTDLDADGHKILNASGGGGGGGTTDYADLENKPKINGVELSGNKTAANLGLAEIDEFGIVKKAAYLEVPGGGSSMFAYDVIKGIHSLSNKRDKVDSTVVADTYQFTAWKFTCSVTEIQAALDAHADSAVLTFYPYGSMGGGFLAGWSIESFPDVDGYEWRSVWCDAADNEDIVGNDTTLAFNGVYASDSDFTINVTATRTKIIIAKEGESYVSPTGVAALTADKMPKYGFADVAVAEGVLTLAPYTNAQLTSDGTAFTVLMGGETGKVRDCVFVVVAGVTAPTISWGEEDGQTFNPRTDAATDMEIAANTTKVFWVTEYAEDKFVVAGWEVPSVSE